MKKLAVVIMAIVFPLMSFGTHAWGTDLTLTTGGRVTIELVSSDATFHNTLSLVSPGAAIAQAPDGTNLTGCSLESTGFGGLELVSEKISQHGCRVELDADPGTAGNQPFASGDVLRFNLCAQTDTDPACEHVWSSDPSLNSGDDHVKITTLHGGNYNLLSWEDQSGLGDNDFDDLVAVVRVVQDTDGDGLWDDWEQSGIDTDGNGTIDFTLPGASHTRKDIYVEIDYMDCATAGGDCASGDTHSHQPKADAIAEIVQAFNNAPVTNPVGPDGITLHIDVDDAIPHQDTLNMGCYTVAVDYDTIKDDPTYFGPNNPRRFAYHYVLFTHQQIASGTASGCGEVSGNDLIVSLGAWNYECQGGTDDGEFCPAAAGGSTCPGGGTCVAEGDVDGDGDDDHDVGSDRQQAGTLMHELGHNLNLRHGGDECTNYKPNYLSIMNYWFQFSGILPGGPLDYSDTALPDLDERNVGGTGQLDETLGIQDGTDDTQHLCPNWTVRTGAGTGAIDWNCDNDNGADTNVSVNINGDCIDTVRNNCGSCDASENDRFSELGGYDDWDNIKYDFQNSKNFEDGVRVDVDIPDMNFKLYKLLVNRPPVCDANGPYSEECQGTVTSLLLDGTGSTDPEGEPMNYEWSTDCPGGSFDDTYSQMPMLGVDTSTQSADCNVTLTLTDSAANSSVCSAPVTVVDTAAPVISCNNPATITPKDAPVLFTATAEDICDDEYPQVLITGYTCIFVAPNGKVIDKNQSCIVSFAGNTLTIDDSGGINDHITWTVQATDNSGNQTIQECSTDVVKYQKP